ncbi:MAG: ATPase, partial [Actinomycetia bacterium]|nr:ATPase [Actinomycetes bacterium]
PVSESCVDLVQATRTSAQVQAGASPRGVDALVKLGRASAMIDGRDYVTPDDVKAVAAAALGHRVVLRPEMWVRGVDGTAIVNECLEGVPTPATLPGRPNPTAAG